jgi:Xaa-Pro aminopeptidase
MSQNELVERLAQLRSHMRQKGAQFCMVRATDIYLNEYVPTEQSRRVYITGFGGSMGDAFIGLDSATLFVDGRYALQAKDEAPLFDVQVLPLGQSIESACLEKLRECKSGETVLIEEDRISTTQFEALKQVAQEVGVKLVSDGALVDQIRSERNETPKSTRGKVWQADAKILGTTLADRLKTVHASLQREDVEGYLLVALDDIAWLSGFRGLDFAYQSTFAARAIVLKDQLWLITPHPASDFATEPGIRCFESFEQAAAELGKIKIGFEPNATPVALQRQLERTGESLKKMANPVQDLKVHKCQTEIDHLFSGFKRADHVVFTTQNWVCDQVMSGKTITEGDVYDYVSARFAASGTVALSFTPICGYAKNAAIIHHSTPDREIAIKEGEMFLLDTGGIYEGGYSTDLTRTFLVGNESTKASKEHKEMFTLVLKAAIIGMSARFPKGTTGVQLDAMVRAPIWLKGLNFAHGTGHGLGINVHEFPPRIATVGHAKIDVGHIFSIEPGLYFPNVGGVRIENLCTVVEDQENKGFLRVLPLTFAPLDERLIAWDMLDKSDLAFLEYFKQRFIASDGQWNSLLPLDG